jgi:hypothetical protein
MNGWVKMSVNPFELVELGLRIFPVNVKNPGTDIKEVKPLVKWREEASSDPAVISRWQSKLGTLLTDWGVPTGHVNGFIVVDIDSAEGDHYWSSQWLPDGLEATTPRGGTHIMYSLDGIDADVQTNGGKLHRDIDIRGEGGFVNAYDVAALTVVNMPALPDSVLEILPERQVYSTKPVPVDLAPDRLGADVVRLTAPDDDGEEIDVVEVTPQEARVLKGLLDILDDLPVPWHEGAGYHNAQFLVACGLNRIANSPYYRTDQESARKLFNAHAPLRNLADIKFRDRRWTEAIKAADGQWFDQPSDVPLRLTVEPLLEKFSGGLIENMYWDGTGIPAVKDLIRELREAGASEQEAYSVSYECAAMKRLRARSLGKGPSTWGFVKEIFRAFEEDKEGWKDEPIKVPMNLPKPPPPEIGELGLLDAREQAMIKDYPNFISRYAMAAHEILASPNMPLVYLNGWIALSSMVGDRADINLKKGRVPLSLWGMPLAPSAAGKGDAKGLMKAMIGCGRRGGFGDVNAGGNASAEGLSDFVAEREGKVALFNKDESSSLLEAMHYESSYEAKMMTLALDLYDGESSRSLRVGNAKDGVGSGIKTTFNMWLQTTWQGAVSALNSKDIGTGFLGRFIVAIGDGANITDDSLRLEFASEYQMQIGGTHPMLKSLADGVNAVIGHVKGISVTADEDVQRRFVRARRDVLAFIREHHMQEALQGVMLRVTENFFKAAALLAISEGRSKVEMGDLLVALKSGQYWVRDALRLSEAISTSEYRKRVDELVRFCDVAPRSRGAILKHFANLGNREVIEVMERAEQEGSIKKNKDNGRFIANIAE